MGVKRKVKRSTNPDEILLIEAFSDFIAEKRAFNLSEATIHNYEQSFDYFCRYGNYDANTLTDAIDQKAIYTLIGDMKVKGVKPSSINHYLRDVRSFLYWCMDSDRKYIDPPFKIREIEKQEEQIKMFSDDELFLLLEKPARKAGFIEWRTWTIVNWVLATGNRASTICDVKISDINFAHKEITLGHTKNKKAQIIPLSSSLDTCLKEYIRFWRKNAPIDGWLFPSFGEDKLTTNALRLSFGRYCDARGVNKSSIHGLRHNFAKQWVKNNGNMFALQKILGHSTLDMTRRYVKLFGEDIKEDYDKYSPLDSLKKGAKRTKKVNKTDY